jgi:hypothetical protein
VEQQWNALGALADRVLRQAAGARRVSVAQLRNAEAGQGAVACQRRTGQSSPRVTRDPADVPRQLELPLV